VRARRGERGFTLVEVMIALAILGGALVVLLRGTAADIFSAQRAQMKSAAAELARAKMYDIEEDLLTRGFQETDQEEEGNFEDDGWPTIKWKSSIVKIELPDMQTLQGVQKQGQEGDQAGGAAGAGGGMLGGLLGQGGMMGGAGGTDAAGSGQSSLGGALMGSYYQMISDVLKDAIRKATLTVSYPVGADTESFTVTCYFTDPSAVNRKIPFAGGDTGEDDGTGTGTGTGTDTSGTGSKSGSGSTKTGAGTGTGASTPTGGKK
jgi:general secretion pathway protein I